MMISSTATNSTSNIRTSIDFVSQLREQVPRFIHVVEETLWHQYHMDVSGYEADHVCWRTETWDEYETLVTALKEQQAPYLDNASTSTDSKNNRCELLIESNIGGRPIATFSLYEGISVVPLREGTDGGTKNNRSIRVIEIPAPKEGSFYQRGLEHVEFVVPMANTATTTTTTSSETAESEQPYYLLTPLNDHRHQSTLEAFMNRYPSLPWNTKALSKKINCDISLKLDLKDHGGDFGGMCSVKFHLMPLAKVISYEKEHNL